MRPISEMLEALVRPVSSGSAGAEAPERSAARPAAWHEAGPPPTDRVELSDAARAALAEQDSTPIRQDLVERVRAEIAAGTYLTDKKLDAVAERLLTRLFES